ncbi:MAG: hypothetical protein RSD95_07765 [Clostridia bacterium]
MTTETTKRISVHANRTGDKLVEIMERCHVINTPDVPEEDALRYLKELEELHEPEPCEDPRGDLCLRSDGHEVQASWHG